MAHADKRSVATDALETLGAIIGENEKRDAIHLAVYPAVAAHRLKPGDHVGLDEDGKASTSVKLIGIVDPFLPALIKPGERFWLVIYPRQITSLRHVWEHPDFPDSQETKTAGESEEQRDSRQWIEAFAENVGLSYSELMKGTLKYIEDGECLNRGDLLEGQYVPKEFWRHYQHVTGRVVNKSDQQDFFTCSC